RRQDGRHAPGLHRSAPDRLAQPARRLRHHRRPAQHWGKGYGTEATRLMVQYAFDTLNLNRVWLHVLEYNERGIRCYEKVGFKKEGLLRQEHFRDGRYWDTHLVAILRDEWLAHRRGDIQ